MSISSKEWHARWVILYHKKKTTLPTRWWKGFWGPHLEGEELRNVLYKPEHLLESHWIKSHKGPTIWRYEVTGRKVSCIALWLLLFPSHEKSLNFKAEIKVRTPPLLQWPSHQGWILFSSSSFKPLFFIVSHLPWYINVSFHPILRQTQPQGVKPCLFSLSSFQMVCAVYAEGLKLTLPSETPES